MHDIIIIGAGVIGAFIARELSKYQIDVLVLDKENDVGNVSSMANSAIVHSGYDPLPGTLKARLNVQGMKMYDKICQELDVKFSRIGSLTVATEVAQCEMLKKLQLRAKENGVIVYLLNAEEVLKLEPRLTHKVKMGLYAPDTGIIDPFNLVVHAMENAIDNGAVLKLNHKVTNIEKKKDHFLVTCDNSVDFQGKIVINAAGLYSEIISNMVAKNYFTITPRKGEYFVLDHFDDNYLNHVIFPLPSDKGKGILLTPTTSHNYLIGPTSEYIDELDDFSTDKLTLDEIKRQVSILVEDVPFANTIRTFSGLRASSSLHDFIIDMPLMNFINVACIDSPGLASAPAIADYVISEFVGKNIALIKKDYYNPCIKKYLSPKSLTKEEREELIKKSPKYGHTVCFCEQISEQEILDVLSRSCPPHSVKAVKKRVRAGFGRCQGGMCQPTILKLLAKHYKLNPLKVAYDKLDSHILLSGINSGDEHE